MKLDLVIPTFNRRKKLENCINSILLSAKNIKINIYLYFNKDDDTWQYFASYLVGIPEIHIKTIKNFKVPDFWNNHLIDMASDGLLYLSDDVEFFKDTLENAITEYQNVFPNYDGILGINQVNIPTTQALQNAFGIIGKNFINFFPNKQVWCPEYFRFFGDRELWLFARSINKFYFSEKTKIYNNHPAFTGDIDNTHKQVRKYLQRDKLTFLKRQKKGYLWGKNFNLLNE